MGWQDLVSKGWRGEACRQQGPGLGHGGPNSLQGSAGQQGMGAGTALLALATQNGARLLATEMEDVHSPQLFLTFGT